MASGNGKPITKGTLCQVLPGNKAYVELNGHERPDIRDNTSGMFVIAKKPSMLARFGFVRGWVCTGEWIPTDDHEGWFEEGILYPIDGNVEEDKCKTTKEKKTPLPA